MRTLVAMLFFALLASALPFVHAQSPDRVASSERASITPLAEVLPLSSHSSDSLSGIFATEKTTEFVLAREKDAYEKIQSRLVSASRAEQPALRSELAEQRRRLLISILNRIVVIYQRLEYVIGNLDASLLRVRVLYRQKGSVGIPDFDARIRSLEAKRDALQSASSRIAAELDAAKDAIELADAIRSSRQDVSSLLQDVRAFLEEYRSLVQAVVQL